MQLFRLLLLGLVPFDEAVNLLVCEVIEAHQFAVDEFGLDERALTEHFCKRVGRVGCYLEQDFRDVLGLAHLRGCLWD